MQKTKAIRCYKGTKTGKCQDIVNAVAAHLREAHEQKNLQVTWIPGHATDQNIEEGKIRRAKLDRNEAADALANPWREIHDVDRVEIDISLKKTAITMLAQTMM